MTQAHTHSTKEKGWFAVTPPASLSGSEVTISKIFGNVKSHVSLSVSGFPVPKVSKLIPGNVSPCIPDSGSHWVRLHRAINPLVDDHKDCLAGDLLKKVRHGGRRNPIRALNTGLNRLSLVRGWLHKIPLGKALAMEG